MPSIPDFPGKSLIGGTTKRARVVVVAVAGGALAVGGMVAKRVLGQGGKEEDRDGDEAPAEIVDNVEPIAKAKPAPKPKAAKPKPKATPKPPKTKDDGEPKPAAKPKPPKPKAAPKPKAETTGTDAPPKPEVEPGNRSRDKGPHQALNNPLGERDETEYPDPFETRPDPRDPVDPDGAPFGEEPHPPTGAESTSEPPLEQDPEVPDGGRPPRRENLDD